MILVTGGTGKVGAGLVGGLTRPVTHTIELVTRRPARTLDAFLLEDTPAFGG